MHSISWQITGISLRASASSAEMSLKLEVDKCYHTGTLVIIPLAEEGAKDCQIFGFLRRGSCLMETATSPSLDTRHITILYKFQGLFGIRRQLSSLTLLFPVSCHISCYQFQPLSHFCTLYPKPTSRRILATFTFTNRGIHPAKYILYSPSSKHVSDTMFLDQGLYI